MKDLRILGIFILVVLFGCVIDAPILDNVHILEVLKDDDFLGVTVKTGVSKNACEKVILKIFRSSEHCTEKRHIEIGFEEYQNLMKIDSPYVIKAIEGEEHDGTYVLMEEYFDGYTIDRLPQKSYDVRDVYEILSQFGEGIDAIHRSGIIHNDLHTGNLMIGSNVHGIRVKIIDLDTYGKIGEPRSTGGVYTESMDWERFGNSMYELFSGKEVQCIYTNMNSSPDVSYSELQNLDPRLARLVDALCISKSIQTYGDYRNALNDPDWKTEGSLEIGMK